MSCVTIIVASGSSRRMGFDKLAVSLHGRSVLQTSIEKFMAAPSVNRVIVVCPQERFDALLQGPFPKPVVRVDGGANRHNSVAAGLAALAPTDPLVAVHDGARPLVAVDMIEACIQEAQNHGAAALARPISETIKRSDSNGFSLEGVPRDDLWHTETPQIFRTDLIRKAYAYIEKTGLLVTDEVSALEAIGHATKLVPSPTPNLKITHPADLALAEALTR
ncbi:MAG: 2-C-methyl-D-erythritol 4-phosphate cytidylyltransferase [Verrucomicrobiales bacterium]